MKRVLGVALAIVLASVPSALAQITQGNIYGSVVDESGAVLPGATVSLTGANIRARSALSGTQGDFRFIQLDPGTYKLAVSLTGFTTVTREVQVSVGVSLDLNFSLKVATVEETVTVTAETPVIDTKKTGTATTIGVEEMSKIPNSRDPWALLRAVPGVFVDRVNQAGSESGQQSGYVGKGSPQQDSMWVLDGIVISDPAAAGASPTYFDFDMFEEIAVTTGGADVKVATGGVGLNFVTKRGTNSFHGSVGGFFTHSDMEGSNLPSELEGDARLKGADKGDHVDQLSDYGFDLGGPILKDKLWFWGGYGVQDLRIVKFNQTKDKTKLKNYNVKLNWQVSSGNMFSAYYYLGDKVKIGRPASALSEEASHTRDQLGYYEEGFPPKGLWKLEDNHIFGPSLVANVRVSHYNTGFTLTPQGGTDQSERLDNVARRAFGSSDDYHSVRPQDTINIDFNHFRGTHELKFGFGYRRASVTSTTSPSGGQVRGTIDTRLGPLAVVRREAVGAYQGDYTFGYLGDTFTSGRMTVNAGVRWDKQTAKNKASAAQGNALYPELLPTLAYDGSGDTIDWNDFSPRLGATLALDESRKTILRGSFAIFTAQLAFSDVTVVNPVGGLLGSRTYRWNDLNGSGFVDAGEADVAGGDVLPPTNFTPTTSNQIDPDHKAARDMEGILGIEREVAPNFAVSAAYTYRRTTNQFYYPFLGVNGTDWVGCEGITSNGFSVGCQDMGDSNVNAIVENDFGYRLTNRPDYNRRFNGFELTAVKRLSNKWMARAAFSYNDWVEHFDGTAGIQNPNPTYYDSYWTCCNTGVPDAKKDGGQLAIYSAASGTPYWVGGKWQVTANAMYELGWGLEIAGNLYGRQGYVRPINITVDNFFGDTVLADDIGNNRLPDVWNLDLRLAKNFSLGGSGRVSLMADLFNAFNSGTTLRQVDFADSGAFNRIDQILNPRLFRVGLKMSF
jgi:hypothetical protein